MQTIAIPNRVEAPRHSLDSLQSYTYRELEAMYRAARTPSSIRAADGVLSGRMLAWNRIDRGPIANALRRFALSPRFVWEGKTLAARDHESGGGFNRVRLGNVLGHQNIFPFSTYFASSLLDGKPTIAIDYDRADNPPWMRRIHDEIREVEPGLFLGLDLWRTERRSVGLVWFALRRDPSARSESVATA